jgi:hypothetical protein
MMLAEYAKSNAQGLFARPTIFAGAIADSRIDDDGVAYVHGPFGSFAHCVDNTGSVGAHDPRRPEGNPRQTLKHEQIEVIERRSGYANTDLSRRDFGNGQIGSELEFLESSVR